MTRPELEAEALSRARSESSLANYPAIYTGFLARGIPESEIRPRENVLTFNAWRALGRTVRKGEHGVKVVTWIPIGNPETDPTTGAPKPARMRPKTAVVFHVSQTDPLEARP